MLHFVLIILLETLHIRALLQKSAQGQQKDIVTGNRHEVSYSLSFNCCAHSVRMLITVYRTTLFQAQLSPDEYGLPDR